MQKLIEAILLAAKFREESYDHAASHQAAQDTSKDCTVVDFNQFYSLTLKEACDKAAEEVGFDMNGTLPIYLLLKNSWNDSLEWATKYNTNPLVAIPG